MRAELAEETCLPREEHLPARDAGSSLWNPERQCDRRADAAHLCDAPSAPLPPPAPEPFTAGAAGAAQASGVRAVGVAGWSVPVAMAPSRAGRQGQ